MSEGFAAPPPPAPAPRTRPATVTVSSLLLLVVLAAAVVYLVASVAVLGDIADAFEEAFEGTEAEDVSGFASATTLLSGIAYLLVAATLAILAIFNNQGRNPARITTWVVGGLGLCCGGVSLIGAALGDVTTGMDTSDPNMPDTQEIERIFSEHVPGWFEPVTLTGNVIGVLALAVALILLALPASNEFFRKPEQPFEPPPAYPPVG